ncbi:hypothetical protein VE04_04664 [Pseudogymnoascus sp. 24MN13]|nr:hypothetical protein VE04_04664 [Pseudogymnoascus sp. 24MN13]
MGSSGFGKGNPNVRQDASTTAKTLSNAVDALRPWKTTEYSNTPAGCPAQPGSESIWNPVFGASPFTYEMIPHGCNLSDAAVILLKLHQSDGFDPKSLSEFKGFDREGRISTSKGTIKKRKQTPCGSTLRDIDGKLMTIEGIVMRGDGRNDQFRDPGDITEANFGKQNLRLLNLWHNRYINGVDTDNLQLGREYAKRWLKKYAPERTDGSREFRRVDCQMRHDSELGIETTVSTNHDDDLEKDRDSNETTPSPPPEESAVKKKTTLKPKSHTRVKPKPESSPNSIRAKSKAQPASPIGRQIEVGSEDEEPGLFSSDTDEQEEVLQNRPQDKKLPQTSLKSFPKPAQKSSKRNEKSILKSPSNPTLKPSSTAQVPPQRINKSTVEKKAQGNMPLQRLRQIEDEESNGNRMRPNQSPRGWSKRFLYLDPIILRKSAVTTRIRFMKGDSQAIVKMASHFSRRDRREVREKLVQDHEESMRAFDEIDEDDSEESDAMDDRPQKKRKL